MKLKYAAVLSKDERHTMKTFR